MIACNKCSIVKSSDDFYASNRVCKECYKAAVRQRRRDNPHYQEYDKLRSTLPHRKENNHKAGQKWRKDNPEKYKAQNTVNNAVRDGKLNKPKCCSVCSLETRIYGHHEDYAKPLDVIWMCQLCHKRHHEVERI